MKNIGELLCEVRKDKGLKIQCVANMLHCSTSFISHLENNRRSMHLSSIIAYCDKLDLELSITNKIIKVKDNVTLKTYTANIKNNIENLDIVKEIEDFYIITSYKNDTDCTYHFESKDTYRKGYSIILKETLVVPFGLDDWFENIDTAIESLNIFIASIKYPHLHELAKETGGKIVFVEQLSLCLHYLGLDNAHMKLRNFCKWRKKEYADDIINFCQNKLGDYGYNLAKEILSIAPDTYRKSLFTDIVAGYEGFLECVTKSTNGKLKNIHQLHSMLSLLSGLNESPLLSTVEEYKSELRSIVDKNIFRYGYPLFRGKLLNSLN